jgi:hypothetical protein
MYVCVQLDPRPTRNNQLCGSGLTKKLLSAFQITYGMIFKFEYLGEFENNPGYESGDQEGAFDERKKEVENPGQSLPVTDLSQS